MTDCIQGKTITLYADPMQPYYAVQCENSRWEITAQPFVRLSDGRTLFFPKPTSVQRLHTGTHDGLRILYTGFEGSSITVTAQALIERCSDDLIFSLQLDGDRDGELTCVSWPGPFSFDAQEGEGYTILARMQGALLPAGKHITLAGGQIFERDAYMPLYGQVWENGAYLGIYDTPYDARYEVHDQNVVPLWIPSLGQMRYIRRMLYRFAENADYNWMAKSYRAYVAQHGRLITLEEKAARNPRVRDLVGCPIIHEGIAVHISPDSQYYRPDDPENNDSYVSFYTRAEQIRALHARGLDKGYTHFDGWGRHGYDNLHPSPFPPHEAAGGAPGMKALGEAVREAGFLFGIHDQYRDYYYDAPDFTLESAVQFADGNHPFCSVWYGGKHTFLCSAVAPDYVRRNYAHFRELGIELDGSYLDVFSVVQLDECFNPAHRVTREQCAENRRLCLDILSAQGIIPSSEETLDCILPSQVLCHHAPFFTFSEEREYIAIPLFNLVYHDCVVIPWIGMPGRRGGWGIPAEDCAYTHAMLNAGPVYCSIEADEADIEQVKTACTLAERLAYIEMLRHEFLSPDYRRQRTFFADGTSVTVDFDTDEIRVELPDQ